MRIDLDNRMFEKAVAFVTQTSKHLFLSGKAGTGKTTFLKYIKENSHKKSAVVAPTGVAAINAGGITIHSFFQLPIGTFTPSTYALSSINNKSINNRSSLIKNLRLRSSHKKLLREIDLLIIDEVSMLRADVLDAIDEVLRHVRKQSTVPFGGIQMLYIGDLFQLPPVVQRDEWPLLNNYYPSPFFFDARVLQHNQPIYLELKHIYRQKDDMFISILNKIRNNECGEKDIDFLNSFYSPDFLPKLKDNFITLTTHNDKADKINELQLGMIPGNLHTYYADITGDFDERIFPNEKVLRLKEGAQIMFIKNDRGDTRRYFNGKIGNIVKLDAEKIIVSFPDETDSLEIEPERWQNLEYVYDNENDVIEEKEIGSFTQLPIRLAWAITIHKSQGLTFDKAIIDPGESFVSGQVYVALSRLKSLEGLILYSKINLSNISTNERVVNYLNNVLQEDQLQVTLEREQWLFIKRFLKVSFDVKELVDQGNDTFRTNIDNQTLSNSSRMDRIVNIKRELLHFYDVSISFEKHLDWFLRETEMGGYEKLLYRIVSATNYYIHKLDEKLISPLRKLLKDPTKSQSISPQQKRIRRLLVLMERKKKQVSQAAKIAEGIYKSASLLDLLQMIEEYQKLIEV